MNQRNMMKMELTDDQMDKVAGGASAGYTSIASGSFSSNTGTGLNIVVSWSVNSSGLGDKELVISVAASSYSLTSQSLVSGVTLTVNGQIYYGSSDAVSYQGNTLATNHLASFTIPGFPGTAAVTASWHFNGSYGGKALTDIVASGTITA
ncbi:MAG: hypothetical protein IJ705_00135 [Oscillospiraceae bacterium]|nr:hypothetical protein [Oscillospiraceae bacterium]